MSDEALNKYLDWLDKCAEEHASEPQWDSVSQEWTNVIHDDKPLSQRIREIVGSYGEKSDPIASAWADEVEGLEARLDHDLAAQAVEILSSRISELEATNADLLDIVRECVNFLADLNSTSPFDAEYMEQRAKALHKRAYTAHSKAKSHADTLKGE